MSGRIPAVPGTLFGACPSTRTSSSVVRATVLAAERGDLGEVTPVKAAVLKQIGDEELDVRADAATTPPGPDEVRVRIRAAGICHSDVSAMNGG